jgi:hypothetical protein
MPEPPTPIKLPKAIKNHTIGGTRNNMTPHNRNIQHQHLQDRDDRTCKYVDISQITQKLYIKGNSAEYDCCKYEYGVIAHSTCTRRMRRTDKVEVEDTTDTPRTTGIKRIAMMNDSMIEDRSKNMEHNIKEAIDYG